MRSLLTKLFGVLFSTFFLHVSVEAADKIRIAIPGTGPFLTFSLAQKKGFFKDEGLDAEIIQIRGGSVAMAALLTGDLDYYSVVAVGARAAIQGLPIRLVACYLPTPPMCSSPDRSSNRSRISREKPLRSAFLEILLTS